MMRPALAFLFIFALSACGFEPVYKQTDRLDVADALAYISIDAPDNRDGDVLKAALEDAFYQSLNPQAPRYRLTPTLQIESQAFIIDTDGISSRYDLNLTSEYQLIRISDNKILKSGQIRREVSYNVSDENDYATYITQNDAKRRGISALADDYQQQIAAQLARSVKAAP
jgi:LPS-assembly lipoprotein